MTSPFPGMDPYLEDPAFWPDFHLIFLNCWHEEIAGRLPSEYEARLDQSINLLEMSPEVAKLIFQDTAVTKGSQRLVEEKRQARFEVLHRPDRWVIAIYKQYRAKRNKILAQNVHLVELDLLVGGDRPSLRYDLPAGDYFTYISRADRRFDCEVYAWTVRDKLPTIPVPLKSPDADIPIDLGKVFRTTYKRGRYARSLSYGKPPAAPLSAADAVWAKRKSMAK
jgi:hypothetical protein